jgi:Na+/melibiose symporter-like transporter
VAKKIGKKRALLLAFVMFAITFVYITMLGKISFIPVEVQGIIMVVLAAIPLAIFGILPNAVIADIAESDGIKTGNFKAGIFFGARTFMSKMGQAVAGIILPSLLARGQEIGDDVGIRMTAIAAIIFIIGGFIFLLSYNEKEVNEVIKAK